LLELDPDDQEEEELVDQWRSLVALAEVGLACQKDSVVEEALVERLVQNPLEALATHSLPVSTQVRHPQRALLELGQAPQLAQSLLERSPVARLPEQRLLQPVLEKLAQFGEMEQSVRLEQPEQLEQ
jgi:hypothetical protein